MTHQLDLIQEEHLLQAINAINSAGVPKDHHWSEYWISYDNKLYQFKYVVEVASKFTKSPIKTTDFHSNDSSRQYIAKKGFHILFRDIRFPDHDSKYWVAASYYGLPGNQTDLIDEFLKNSYWRTDHDLSEGEGLKVYNDLKLAHINDRLCLRYLDKKGSTIKIAAIGTVTDISEINNGRLGIIWDYGPPLYEGVKPGGLGSGNWWRTIFQLKNETLIPTIFNNRIKEKRVARIAWNENEWVYPSGPYGKSLYKDSHEFKYGYGHEEWLFDTGKIINGFHYGFLEPIRKQQDSYSNKLFDVWLYTINDETKERFWIGEIHNLEVLHQDEAERIKKIYQSKGWLNEMEDQIKASGASNPGFSNFKGVDIFNIRFRVYDLYINDELISIPGTNPVIEQTRYSFSHFTKDISIDLDQDENDFTFTEGNEDTTDDLTNPTIKTQFRSAKPVEIKEIHKQISINLTNFLKKKYGNKNVRSEHRTGNTRGRIDIVVKENRKLIFYEIKTYNKPKTSIREAIGQLFEYSFWPDKKKAEEMVIVTQHNPDDKIKRYFKHIRVTLNIPFFYQYFDTVKNELSEKF